MDDPTQGDSVFSFIANIAGVLTFIFAFLAAIWAQIRYMENSEQEYFQVKTSLSWYKVESTWLAELVKVTSDQPGANHRPEYQMYTFVMDDLIVLEQRLLELVEEVESKAGSQDELSKGKRWAVVPKSWGLTVNLTMTWYRARKKALDLVRQREALAARVSFTQMSMISSRIRELEQQNSERDTPRLYVGGWNFGV